MMAAGNPVFLLCPHSTQQLQFSLAVPDLHTPDSLYEDDSVTSYVPFLTTSSTTSSSSTSSSSSSTSSTPDQESVALPGNSTATLTLCVPPSALSVSSGRAACKRQQAKLALTLSASPSATSKSAAFLAQSEAALPTSALSGPNVTETISRYQGKSPRKQRALNTGARSERRPDTLMFARPGAVAGGAKMTRSASRRAKLSRVKVGATSGAAAPGVHPQGHGHHCSASPDSTPSSTRPFTLPIQSQAFSSTSDSFSQRLLAGAVEAAQHLEETLAHVTSAPVENPYMDLPLNYELYLASSSQGQTVYPALSSSMDTSVNPLRAENYLPRFDVQRSLPLPPISSIRGLPPPKQHHHVGYVFDAPLGHYPIQNTIHIPRNMGGLSLPSDNFPSSHNTTSTHAPDGNEVIVIDDEPESVSCDQATPKCTRTAVSQYQVGSPQSTPSFPYISSHEPNAHTARSIAHSGTDSCNGNTIYSKTYLSSGDVVNLPPRKKHKRDRPKKYLRVDANPSINESCPLESQGESEHLIKSFDGCHSQITETGFNFTPAYLSSRRGGFDFGVSNLVRNAGVSLDATLDRQPGNNKPPKPHVHPFGDAAAKPHYSSDDTLITPSVFVFPSNDEQVEISCDKSMQSSDDCSNPSATQCGYNRLKGGAITDLTPVSPPGQPPLPGTGGSLDGLQGFQLLVSGDGSVCPGTQEEGKQCKLFSSLTHTR